MAKQSFLFGTIILMIANGISKILGAVFKIPLTYILKEEGMAIFNTAFLVYSIFLNFVIAGFPLAISNITAKYYATKKYSHIKSITSVSLIILALTGLTVSSVLFFGADFFAYALKDPDASFAIKVISPSVFLVALSTVHKGFFQGSQNMIPTAISQVTESIVRLFAGFGVAYILLPYGIRVSSGGAIFGITFGELLSTSMLFIMYWYSKKRLPDIGTAYSKKSAAKELFDIVIPMFLCTCILSGLSMADTSIVRNALVHIKFTPQSAENFVNHYSEFSDLFNNIKTTLKMDILSARWLYGAYSGYAMTVFNLPAGIIGSMTGVILPVISGNLAENNHDTAIKTAKTALLLTMIIALPCSFCMFFYSEDILNLLYNNIASARLLSALAPCLIFVSLSQLLGTFLHAVDIITLPALTTGIGILVKIVLAHILISIPEINIYGAPLSSLAAYFVIFILNVFLIRKKLPFNPQIKNTVLKPFLCTVFMGIFMFFTKEPLVYYIGNKPGFILCCLLGGLLYFLSLYITKTLKF